MKRFVLLIILLDDGTNGTKRYTNRASSTNRSEGGCYYNGPTTLFTDRQDPVEPARCANRCKSSYNPRTSFDESKRSERSWQQAALEAGINIDFPGSTEHKDRYKTPSRGNFAGFTINPQPDLTLLDRRFEKFSYEPSFTEYQSKYTFPDANAIDKFPWIKKL